MSLHVYKIRRKIPTCLLDYFPQIHYRPISYPLKILKSYKDYIAEQKKGRNATLFKFNTN